MANTKRTYTQEEYEKDKEVILKSLKERSS